MDKQSNTVPMSGLYLTARPSQSIWRRVLAASVRRWLALRYRIFGRRYGRLVIEEIDGVPLIVLPEVFNPVLLRTGEFMAQTLAAINIPPQAKVLDLGTGSGVGAVFTARHGAEVTAVDINPEAVRCAQMNALLNHLDDHIQTLQSDLFSSLADQRFDLILFNPPFYRGRPSSSLDHAWRGEDVFERFTAELHDHLTPNGQALLILSSDGDGNELLALLADQGYAVTIKAEKNLINEQLTMYAVQQEQHTPKTEK
ncbi:MAG: HemK2/MTQ2 family protein methyltransferase [Candidatus Promineifilaceae bacterium]